MKNNDLVSWLGLKSSFDFTKSRLLGGLLGFLLVLVIFAVSIGALASLIEFLRAAFRLPPYDSPDTDVSAAIRNIGLVLAAAFGAPFVAWRSYVAHRQSATAEQSHITDQINKAVEGLGAERVVKGAGLEEFTTPNIEVRIGAIYALERISQDSARDYFKIIEILCAYVRENARATDLKPSEQPFEMTEPRADIQTAITILARRSEDRLQEEKQEHFRLDLRGTDLSGGDFSGGDFSAALLTNCRLEAAQFRGCDLTGTIFSRSLLNYCSFHHAKVVGTVFSNVIFNQDKSVVGAFALCEVKSAFIEGADFSGPFLSTENFKSNVT